jgi:hypothetical protein
MSNMVHAFPTHEQALKARYAIARANLGIRAARPFYFRPAPPEPAPELVFEAPEPTPTLTPPSRALRRELAAMPTKKRIQLVAQMVAERIKADPLGNRLRHFPVVAAKVFQVPLDTLLSPCRHRYSTRPRQIGQTLATIMTTSSLPAIGRDHTTVLHARNKWQYAVIDALAEITLPVQTKEACNG